MSIIDTYSNNIYEWDLVVANKDATLVELKELFKCSNGDELPDNLNSSASTISVIRKSDNKYCCLTKFNCYGDCCKTSRDKILWLANTAAHEAAHYCLDIYNSIGDEVCTSHQEPFCYLLGWATECIYKTWTKTKNGTIQKRKQAKG